MRMQNHSVTWLYDIKNNTKNKILLKFVMHMA